MAPALHIFPVQTADDTAQLAADIGACVSQGDTLLLEGDIGAGKTHFARSLIQSLQSPPEDVPSPTFTLIQTYDTQAGEVWHADLYRLSGPGDIYETGLFDAMEQAVCLIEWPDRLGPDRPADALTLHFAPGDTDDARQITLTSADPTRWTKTLGACFA